MADLKREVRRLLSSTNVDDGEFRSQLNTVCCMVC